MVCVREFAVYVGSYDFGGSPPSYFYDSSDTRESLMEQLSIARSIDTKKSIPSLED
jgi:hypothetical protein